MESDIQTATQPCPLAVTFSLIPHKFFHERVFSFFFKLIIGIFIKIEMKHILVIYLAFCLEVAQGRMNGAPNEIRTRLWRLASQARLASHYITRAARKEVCFFKEK